MVSYVSVGVLVLVLVFTGFFATVSRVSLLVLHGLHAYVLPDDAGGDQTPDRGAGGTESNTTNNGREKQVGEAVDKFVKRRGGKKKKQESSDVFDEAAGAQILRMRLTDGQLESRKYFREYDEAVIYCALGVTSCAVWEILQFVSTSDLAKLHGWSDTLAPDDKITFTVTIFVVYKLFRLLAKASFDEQLARSERLPKWSAGALGFLVACTVLMILPTFVVDFGIDRAVADTRRSMSTLLRKKGVDMSGEIVVSTITVKLLLAVMASLCSGLLIGPAQRHAKSFWAGTDQAEWNISVLKRSRYVRALLNLAAVLPLLVALLWVEPIAEIFVRHTDGSANIQTPGLWGLAPGVSSRFGVVRDDGLGEEQTVSKSGDSTAHDSEEREHVYAKKLVGRVVGFVPDAHEGEDSESRVLSKIFVSRKYDWTENLGVAEGTFRSLRLWGLFFTGLLQVLLVRVNLQTYCNGAVIVWYENLHRSKVHNPDVVKAKIFLNNFFVCRVAIQLLVPGALVVLITGLARSNSDHQEDEKFLFPTSFVQAVTYFSCWWMVCISALQTWVALVLFRVGISSSVAN